jgi:Cysteine rich repeat
MAPNIARFSLVTAILLLMGPAALAQTDYLPLEQEPMSHPTTTQPVRWDRGAGFRVECGQDLQRFCNGVQPGEGRLIECLSSHRSELSSECISRLAARPALGVRMDCGQDLQRFCNGVQPGEGRLIRCLSSHRSELSSACTARVAAARPVAGEVPTSENMQSPGQPSAGVPTSHTVTEGALRASCGPDAQKLCGGISRENGAIIKCLSAHRMELSPTCDAFFNKMPVQRAAQKGTPKAKSATASPAATPAMTNGTASTGAPPTSNGSSGAPSATNDATHTRAAPATNGTTPMPPGANDAAETGAAPATNDAPGSSPPPPANSLPAKRALAIPL